MRKIVHVPIFAAVALAGGPDPGMATWLPVVEGEMASVLMEPVLYEAPSASGCFFVRIAVLNRTEGFLGVDLRDYWQLLRPVQYVGSDEAELTVIDICAPVPPELTPELEASILEDYSFNQLRGIAAGASREYYVDFNAAGRVDIEALPNEWLFLGMSGWLWLTDGIRVEQLHPDEGFVHVRLELPAAWRSVPPGSVVAYDGPYGGVAETLAP
ncbi:hypothetical protein JW921_04030 [Candidatus Fermentibacterales bacterium]|nr:hypothetical protein [Candidatus Fermentibacterales bacterium]